MPFGIPTHKTGQGTPHNANMGREISYSTISHVRTYQSSPIQEAFGMRAWAGERGPETRRSLPSLLGCLTWPFFSLQVIESWEALRRIKDYESVAGTSLFQRYAQRSWTPVCRRIDSPSFSLFRACPKAKVLFGFPIDIDPDSPELLNSKRFIMHGSYMIEMLDTAINMLGPDQELLTEIMTELGAKHVRYGVQPEFFPIMGESLIATLQERLGDDVMSEAVVEAWKETYAELSNDMIVSRK